MPSAMEKLFDLLETLTTQDRKEITLWLLGRTSPMTPAAGAWLSGRNSPLTAALNSPLPAGEDSQLVTIRLPADRHAELRGWCTDHGFTMAAVVRGLIERFLDEQLDEGRNRPSSPA
jgi:hypothetical protein